MSKIAFLARDAVAIGREGRAEKGLSGSEVAISA